MATISGSADTLATLTDLSEHVAGWLRQYSGYRGVFVLVGGDDQSSHLITLWDTYEDELAARQARGEMRDRLMAMVGLEVVSFDVYDVRGHEYLGA